jgi:hypothetical protein
MTAMTKSELRRARAEARDSLVHAAIALQSAVRELGYVDPAYLQFGTGDRELDQAPQVIEDAIGIITNTLRGFPQPEARAAKRRAASGLVLIQGGSDAGSSDGRGRIPN